MIPLWFFGCDGGVAPATLTADSFDFDPGFIATARQTPDLAALVAPRDLTASAAGGAVTLTWSMPKYYAAPRRGIAFRVYMKEGAAVTGATPWDFQTPFAADRSTLRLVAVASDVSSCQRSGVCRVVIAVGGPRLMQVAVITTDNLSATGEGGGESAPATTAVQTFYVVDDARYNRGFIDGQFGGAIAIEGPPPPTSIASYRLGDDAAVDPWLLPPDGFVASDWRDGDPAYTPGHGLPVAPLAPVLTSVDPRGEASSFPDRQNHRIIVKTRPGFNACDASRGTPFYEQCLRILRQTGLAPTVVVGQPDPTTAHPFAANPLGPTRAISGGTYASTIARDADGELWFFVADQARILVRRGLPGPCSLESIATFSRATGGVLANGVVAGPEGSCGFGWSIGTTSPRVSCPLRADGSEATGDVDCSALDLRVSMADATRPSHQSLRYPGAPAIIGDHLYIPDAGNARVVRLAHFKTALASCGRLKPPGASVDPRCGFDMLLGQTDSATGAADAFSRRKCVRGGERGGRDGLTVLPDFFGVADPLEPTCGFVGDPACAQNTGTGIACLLDTVTEVQTTPAPREITRRKRQARDYKNTTPGVGMISASTGLLDDKALAMFRFPVAINRDHHGRILITDVGQSFAEEAATAPTHAVLGTRVMIWNRDPLAIADCPVGGDCAMTALGACDGPSCTVRPCRDSECQAFTLIGQKNAKFAHAGFTGAARAPRAGELGFIPIASVSIPASEEGRGIWAVNGQDRRVYRWREADQFEVPDIHNSAQRNGIGGEAMLGGAFSGIEVDTAGSFVTAYDAGKNLVMSWFAPSSDTVLSPTPPQ